MLLKLIFHFLTVFIKNIIDKMVKIIPNGTNIGVDGSVTLAPEKIYVRTDAGKTIVIENINNIQAKTNLNLDFIWGSLNLSPL